MRNTSLKKGAGLLIGVAAAIYAVLAVPSFVRIDALAVQDSYLASLIDKDARLASLEGPRIIFVGGSSMGFGMDSERVEQATKLPVINCGTHIGLGLTFMLNQVKAHLKSGDFVVISTEYEITLDGSRQVDSELESVYADAMKYKYPSKAPDDMLRSTVVRAQVVVRDACIVAVRQERPQADKVYSRKAINRQGDVVGHLGLTKNKKLGTGGRPVSDASEFIASMNEFIAFAKDRGARVVFSYPPLAASSFEPNRKAIGDFQKRMTSLPLPILGEPADFAFADECFYDTFYHLNGEGRALRTGKILQFLVPILADSAPPADF